MVKLAAGTQEWHEQRSRVIGATDIAAIVGLHPYTSALKVWRQKMRIQAPDETNDQMERGTWLEPYVAHRYQSLTGNKIKRHGRMVVKRDWPVAACTPDYYVLNSDILLEIKTANQWSMRGFGTPNTDEVPDWYLCQCQWQMLITGRASVHLALLANIDDIRLYEIAEDINLQNTLLNTARSWWDVHMIGNTCPPITGHDADTEILRESYPTDNGETLRASFEDEEELAHLFAIKTKIKELEAEEAELSNRIKSIMGNFSRFDSARYTCSWTQNKPTRVTDWKSIAAELEPSAELVEQHTKLRDGARPFTIKERKE